MTANYLKQLLIFILSICLSNTYAQKSDILETYVQEGLRNNLSLQQQELEIRKSREAVREARGLSYPALDFEASYTRAAGGRKIDFPIGDLLNPAYAALNQLTQSNAFPSLENQAIQFLPDNFQETKVKFAYPLYNTDLRYNRQIKEHIAAGEGAKKEILEHLLRHEITAIYLQYLQALEAEKIWLSAKTVYTELRRFNQSLVDNNVATKDVVSTADYEISKADKEIHLLRSQQNIIKNYFNTLIYKDMDADIRIDTSLLRAPADTYDPGSLREQALANRQELEALQAGIKASETAVKLLDANRKIPDFYLGGELGFQGFGYNFGDNQAFVLAQVGLRYNLYNGGQTKSKAQQSRLENEKMRTKYTETQQNIALQVSRAWHEYEGARNSWNSNRSGLQAAEASFRIVNNKYKANKVLLIEFLEAQNRVTTARMQVLLSWADVLLKENALRLAAGLQ